jgi:hypothetical protein
MPVISCLGGPFAFRHFSFARFFSPQAYLILRSELFWIWLPAGLFAVLVLVLRTKARRDCAELTSRE